MWEFLEHIDHQVFLLINGFHSNEADWIMGIISGKLTWIPLYVLLLWGLIKKYRTRAWIPVLALILSVVLADQLSVHAFKNVFERYRPCHNLELQSLVHLLNNHCGGRYGFVSSHAANSFAIAVLSALFFDKRKTTLALIFWAAIVAYSRVYLGVHYPADVFVGGLLGSVIAVVLFYTIQKTKVLKKQKV